MPSSVPFTWHGARPWRAPAGAVMFVACARDIEAQLRGAIPVLDALAAPPLLHAAHDGVSAWVCEDGAGPTRRLLEAWQRRSAAVRLAQPSAPSAWDRFQRLALCRNALLEEAVRSLPASGTLVALDLDCGLLPPSAMVNAIAALRSSPWEVSTANSPGRYRDLLALRSATLNITHDCWQERWPAPLRRYSTPGGLNCGELSVQIEPAAPPLLVDSAFNGLALYKAAALLRAPHCRYAGTAPLGPAAQPVRACEHLAFHACLRQAGARVAIVPSLVVDCRPPARPPPRKVITLHRDGTLTARWRSRRRRKAFPLMQTTHGPRDQARGI